MTENTPIEQNDILSLALTAESVEDLQEKVGNLSDASDNEEKKLTPEQEKMLAIMYDTPHMRKYRRLMAAEKINIRRCQPKYTDEQVVASAIRSVRFRMDGK